MPGVNLINPVDYRQIEASEPLLFFAGPVQGAPDYQAVFGRIVLERRPDFVVATPRVPHEIDRRTFDFHKQVDWEDEHLWRAARFGGVAFWFAAQDHTLPYPEGRAYAQTTRIELGKVTGWRRFAPLRMAVGFDPEYEGGSERYIRRMLEREQIDVANSADEFVEHIDLRILRHFPAAAVPADKAADSIPASPAPRVRG